MPDTHDDGRPFFRGQVMWTPETGWTDDGPIRLMSPQARRRMVTTMHAVELRDLRDEIAAELERASGGTMTLGEAEREVILHVLTREP